MNTHPSVKSLPLRLAFCPGAYGWGCLAYLLQSRFVHYFDLNATPYYNRMGTMLERLILESKVEILEKLLQHDVDINRYINSSWGLPTPLVHAMDQYQDFTVSNNALSVARWKVLRLLVTHGCDVNAASIVPTFLITSYVSDEKCAPVTIASHPEVLELLILAGADISEDFSRRGNLENIVLQSRLQVYSLKHWSRLSLRAAIKSNRTIKVHELRGILPPALVDYLMLTDIDDIEDKYASNIQKVVCDSSK